MKSIIEQASSIMKAIEKAWNQADNPKEFSIKIFEKEEKNFFGLTSKPAKIGIFYTDKPVLCEKPTAKNRPDIKDSRSNLKESTPKQVVNQQEKNQQVRTEQLETEPSRLNKQKPGMRQAIPPVTNHSKPNPIEKTQKVPAAWNDKTVSSAQMWLEKILILTEKSSITFTTEIIGKILKLTFSQPLIADPMQEKQLFRSLAHLVMASLRNQYKQEIKDLKVILIRPE